MSVGKNEIDSGVRILRELGAKRVVIFGSAATSPQTARDIDFGCEGLPPDRFFRAVGVLIAALGRDVDLVDLSLDSRRTRFIRNHSKVLYDG